MKDLRLFGLITALILCSFQVKAQNRSNSQRVQQLPPGHQLRSAFNGLPPKAKAKAENWLNRLNIPDEDFSTLRIDDEGGVFYADTFYTETSETGSIDSASPEIAGITAADIFTLHSKPGASKVVHLNFEGYNVTGTGWNNDNKATFFMLPYDSDGDTGSFSAQEINDMAAIWHRVAEDYAAFDVDITTEAPPSYGPNIGHILITNITDAQGDDIYTGGGGVAYVDVWGYSNFEYYQPALVFHNNLNSGNAHNIAEASSHELGHNLSLSHDGTNSGTTYYGGHGTGLVEWAPIMGVSYYMHVSQWSKGEYSDANNTEDDILEISNRLGYSPDDHGDAINNASPLLISSDGTVDVTNPENDPENNTNNNKGVISTRNDIDIFSFETTGGQINLNIRPAWEAYNYESNRGANLDVRATLYDSTGNTIGTYSYPNDTYANISTNLSAGTYFIGVEGESSANYSDYGSIGQFFISGTIEGAGVTNGSETAFAMLGDFGENDSQASSVANLVNSWNVDFVTTAGDNRYGSISFDDAVGNKYCEWIANPGISCTGEAIVNKFFPAPGNHDYSDGLGGGINEYLSYFDLPGAGTTSTNTSGNERYYDFIQGDVHFFMLDSDRAISSATDRTAQQTWLQNQLAASTANWKVVILHHAPYSSGNHGSNSTMQWPYAAWGADVVMAGHDHHYERIHRDGIVYIVNGLGGRSLYNLGAPITGSQISYNSNYGAVQASVTGDIMNIKFINIAGATIDDYNVTKTVTPPNDGVIDVQIAGSLDDVEERVVDGAIDAASSDIELGDDPGFNEDQTVGLLFRNINIPQGSAITSAFLEFTVDEIDTAPTNVIFKAHAADNASDFSTTTNNISNRAATANSVSWDIPSWDVVGVKKQSPDLTAVVQELVNRSGWSSGNKMVFIITGTGSRTAESFDGSAGNAAKLHIEFGDAPTNENPIANFTADVTNRSVSFTDTSTDSDGAINAWSWDFGDGNSSTDQNPVHNYTSDGDFTVSLTVTDDDAATNATIQTVTTCLDSDGDGVCDDQDICANEDDTLDTDSDNIPDACDTCPNDPENDADGDGVCGDLDICPGGDDTFDADGDGIPDFCDSCNDTIDTDQDGLNDCIDQEINSPCPQNVDSNGISIDSDNDGVADCNDVCAGGDDSIDSDGDGIPDACEDSVCEPSAASFSTSSLSHSGTGTSSTSVTIPTYGQDVLFTVSSINQKTNGNPKGKYTEQVTISYVDGSNNTIAYGVYSGANTSSVNVNISGAVQSVTVELTDILDGDLQSGSMNISLSPVEFCVETVPCSDADNDGICDDDDQCPGADDTVDTDGDGVIDCLDQEIDSSCPNNVDANGKSIDTDSDGVCDDLDNCPAIANPQQEDADNNGVGDACDNPSTCEDTTASFSTTTLTSSGTQTNSTSANLNGRDMLFTISEINEVTNGKPNNRYIEQVTVSYINSLGDTVNYGVFSGTSSVVVSIPETVQSVTVSLADGYDGNSPTQLSVNLSVIDFCMESAPAASISEPSASAASEDYAKSGFEIYPNPASTVLHINTDNRKVFNGNVSLYSFNGQLIVKKRIEAAQQQLELSTYHEGLYMLLITDEKGAVIRSKRVVIKH